jgi:hypothetical protein
VFDICLVMRDGFRLSGLDALDWRRARGLPDGTRVVFDRNGVKAGVGEAFARAYFGRTQTVSTMVVPPDLLAAGDLRPANYNDEIVTFVELTPERVRELWLAAYTAELRAAVPDLGGDAK